MASCLKCGTRKITSKSGVKSCKRCGILPSGKNLDRSGKNK